MSQVTSNCFSGFKLPKLSAIAAVSGAQKTVLKPFSCSKMGAEVSHRLPETGEKIACVGILEQKKPNGLGNLLKAKKISQLQ